MLAINTNLASLVAQRHLAGAESARSAHIERLSTGLRINSAKDDSAGLAISDRMRAQISGLKQGHRNLVDGRSLLTVAESQVGLMTSGLQRIREMAVQAANGTNNADDRAALQAEVLQIVSELERQATAATFNGRKLLDGSFGTQTLQIGPNIGSTLSVALADVRPENLGLFKYSTAGPTSIGAAVVANVVTTNGILTSQASQPDVTVALAGNNVGAQVISIKGPSGNSSIPELQSVTVNNSDSAKTIAANMALLAGVTTTVNPTAAKFLDVVNDDFNLNENDLLRFTLNGTLIEIRAGATSAETQSNLTSAVTNAFLGTGLSIVNNGDGSFDLTAADGANIEIENIAGQNNSTVRIQNITAAADDTAIFTEIDGVALTFDGSGSATAAIDNLLRALNFRLGTASASAQLTVTSINTQPDDTNTSVLVDGSAINFDGSGTAGDRLDQLAQALDASLGSGGVKTHKVEQASAGAAIKITRLDGLNLVMGNLSANGALDASMTFLESDGVNVTNITEGGASTQGALVTGPGAYWLSQSGGTGGAITMTRKSGGDISFSNFTATGAGNAGLALVNGAGSTGAQSLLEGSVNGTTISTAKNSLIVTEINAAADDTSVTVQIDGQTISFDGSNGAALTSLYSAALAALGPGGANTYDVSQIDGENASVVISRKDGLQLQLAGFSGNGAGDLTGKVLTDAGEQVLSELGINSATGGTALKTLRLQGARGQAVTLVEKGKDSAAVSGTFDVYLEPELAIESSVKGAVTEGSLQITGFVTGGDDDLVSMYVDGNKIEFDGRKISQSLDQFYQAALGTIGDQGLETHFVTQSGGPGTAVALTRRDGFDLTINNFSGSGAGVAQMLAAGLNGTVGVTNLDDVSIRAFTAVPDRVDKGLFNAQPDQAIQVASTATNAANLSLEQLTVAGDVISFNIDGIAIGFVTGADPETTLNSFFAAMALKDAELASNNVSYRKLAGMLEIRSSDADPIVLTDFVNSGSNDRGLMLSTRDDTVVLSQNSVTNLIPGAIVQSRSSGTEGVTQGNYTGAQQVTITGKTPVTISIPKDSEARKIAELVNAEQSITGVSAAASTEAWIETLSSDGVISFNLYGLNVGAAFVQVDAVASDLSTLATEINTLSLVTGISAEHDLDANRVRLLQSDGADIRIENFEHANSVTDPELNDGNSTAVVQSIKVRGSEEPSAFVALFDGKALLDSEDQDSVVVGGKVQFESCRVSLTSTLAGAAGGLFNIAANAAVMPDPNYLVTGIDVSSQAGASSAISIADCAIDQLSSFRANVGALINRVDSALASSQVSAINLQASVSRITDADYAAETAALTKQTILQESSVAMVAQANALPEMVLSLLRDLF